MALQSPSHTHARTYTYTHARAPWIAHGRHVSVNRAENWNMETKVRRSSLEWYWYRKLLQSCVLTFERLVKRGKVDGAAGFVFFCNPRTLQILRFSLSPKHSFISVHVQVPSHSRNAVKSRYVTKRHDAINEMAGAFICLLTGAQARWYSHE